MGPSFMFAPAKARNRVKEVPMKGTEVLREEHKKILKVLHLLDTICNRLKKEEIIPIDHLKTIIRFISDYADAFHHAKEEDVLLPFLDKTGMPKNGKQIEEILEEHLLQRSYVEAMTDALAHSEFQSSETIKKFVSQARNLMGLLSEHIFKEDTLLLPWAERLFTQSHQEELDREFKALEKEKGLTKKIETLCEDVHNLEKIYLGEGKPKPTCCGCTGHA